MIRCLFIDIGGVILTNGWDHNSRKRAAEHFGYSYEDFEDRHHLNFEVLEIGKMTLDEYLDRTLFYKERPISKPRFRDFMLSESKRLDDTFDLFLKLKKEHDLKIVAVSNEGRDLNDFRIAKFKMDQLIDFFVSSCYVGLRKPDLDIFRLAFDQAQVPLAEAVFIDNTALFVEIARKMGVRGIVHESADATEAQLLKHFV